MLLIGVNDTSDVTGDNATDNDQSQGDEVVKQFAEVHGLHSAEKMIIVLILDTITSASEYDRVSNV